MTGSFERVAGSGDVTEDFEDGDKSSAGLNVDGFEDGIK